MSIYGNASSSPVGPFEADYDLWLSTNGNNTGYISGASAGPYMPFSSTVLHVVVKCGDTIYLDGTADFWGEPVSGSKGYVDYSSTSFTATSANQSSTPVNKNISLYGWRSGTLLITVTASSWSDPSNPPVFSLLAVDPSGNVVEANAVQGQDGFTDPVNGFTSGSTFTLIAADISLGALEYALFTTLANSGDSVTYSARLIGNGDLPAGP